MLFKLAWRNLWRNRRRTFITMASVLLAAGLAIFMRSLQEGTYENMIRNMVEFYTGYVQVHQKGYWDDKTLENSFENEPQVYKAAEGQKHIEAFVPRFETFGLASSGTVSKFSMVVGIDPAEEDKLTGLRGKVVQGEYLTPNSTGILVAEKLAAKLNLSVGDELILLGQGYHAANAYGLYPIEGIVHYGSPDLNERLIFMTIQEASLYARAEGRLTAFAVKLDEPKTMKKVVNSLRSKIDTAQYEVMSWEEMTPELVQFVQSDRAGGVLTMGVLYMIIAFGMFGTVLMMTAERQYEFGVMVAIGMKRSALALIILIETVILSILGVLAGIIVSLPFVTYFHFSPIQFGEEYTKAYEDFGIEAVIPTVIDPSIFVSQAFVILVFAMLVSLYPMWKILRMDPIQSMRG